jgi:hypothetical protein
MVGIIIPQHSPDGMQTHHFHQNFRLGTCEEFGCEWFRDGREGEDGGLPFSHPQGVRCGDYSRCKPCTNGPRGPLCGACGPCKAGTANCPCPSRLARSMRNPAVRGHLVPELAIDGLRDVDLRHALGRQRLPAPVRELGSWAQRAPIRDTEWLDRLHEGTYTLDHIRTRGI